MKEAHFLKLLFSSLEVNNIDYVILRGYKDLPQIIHNDVDFFVSPSSLYEFFACLLAISKEFSSEVKIVLIRQGVIKCKVESSNFSMDIDFWYNVTFWGLSYSNCFHLLSKKRHFKAGFFFIPDFAGEFEISFLKEILHNQQIRCDKIDELKVLLQNSSFENESIIDNITTKTFLSNKLIKGCGKRYYLFLVLFFGIFNWNIKKYGLLKVYSSVRDFLAIRFIKSNAIKIKSELFIKAEILLESGVITIK
jgi:hypothetical protein